MSEDVSRIVTDIGAVDDIMMCVRAVKEPEESHLLPGLLRELEEETGPRYLPILCTGHLVCTRSKKTTRTHTHTHTHTHEFVGAWSR